MYIRSLLAFTLNILFRTGLTNEAFTSGSSETESLSSLNTNKLLSWTSALCLLHVIGVEHRINMYLKDYETTFAKYNHPVVIEMCYEHFSCFMSAYLTKNRVTFYHTRLSKSSCTIANFLLGKVDTMISESHLVGVLQYMESNAYLDENPRYGLLMFEKMSSHLEKATVSKFFSSLQLVYTRTRYFVAYEDKSLPSSLSIQIVCLHCSHNHQMLLEISSINGLKEADKMWMNIHKNLSGTIVTVKRPDLVSFQGGGLINCHSLGIDFRGEPRLCVLNLLSSFLGFKIELQDKKSWNKPSVSFLGHLSQINDTSIPLSRIAYNEVDNWQAINTFRDNLPLYINGSLRTEWVPHGWISDPLKFLLIMDKASLNSSALYKPYDVYVWMLTLISLVLVGILLSFSLWAHNRNEYYYNVDSDMKPNRTDVVKILIMSLGSIIEQNPTDKTARKSIHSFRILFGMWLLVSIVISNGYTGIVISFLCSSVLPGDLPTTLKEVVDSKYPIVSCDMAFIVESNRSFSLAYLLLLEYIAHSAPANIKQHYVVVQKETAYFQNISKDELMFLYEQKIPVPKKETYVNRVLINRPFVIPKNFVYVSSGRNVRRLFEMIKFNPKLMVWSPPSNETISVTLAYTAPRNYFSVIFKAYLYFIYDAGLPNIWLEKERELYRRLDMQRYACWKSYSGKNKQDSIWNSSNCSKSKTFDASEYERFHTISYGDDESKPLPLDNLVTTFKLFMVGIMTAGLGFIAEIVIVKLEGCRNYLVFERKSAKNSREKDIPNEIYRLSFGEEACSTSPIVRLSSGNIVDVDFSVLPGALGYS